MERCYAFHGCQYLLHFCLSLKQMEPSLGYRFTDNRDGTTSMYHGSTGKLLVTFRNENKVSVVFLGREERGVLLLDQTCWGEKELERCTPSVRQKRRT